MEGHCSTGQNPQWAVVPMEEEEEEEEEEVMSIRTRRFGEIPYTSLNLYVTSLSCSSSASFWYVPYVSWSLG